MQKQTTGATVSRLGVLTVLAHNQLTENHVSDEERDALLAQIDEIREGKCGVSAAKVEVRTVERCVFGGALYAVNGIGIYGLN